MEINLFEFEKKSVLLKESDLIELNDEQINQKYEKGEARIITEQGAIKLPLVNGVFKGSNYQLRPTYQRRITWDSRKRSKLIESFIMNIPVPPIFVYETDYGKYQVMDGLQRVSAIVDFYDDAYPLEGLLEWKELNGRFYSTLPEKIREGIDRRQITVVTLLKESAKDVTQEQNMKKMVFERLNTGGVKLEDQEIRNALYSGKFNDLCVSLSENELFRKLWGIPTTVLTENDDIEEIEIDENAIEIAKNRLYMRMYDVELVLRFFALRHLDEYNVTLSDFLDCCLRSGNKFSDESLKQLRDLFERTIEKAYKLFEEKAFSQYSEYRKKMRWSAPQKMVYDALMLTLPNYDFKGLDLKVEKNVQILQKAFENKPEIFDGKKQSKTEIKERIAFFADVLNEIVAG